MDRDIALSVFASAIVTYYVSLVFYRLFLHPLALFPGPKLAAISRWYEAYYDVVLTGQYTRKIADLHRSYGPIIRISPHELHVHDPAFFGTLYRVDGRWDKYSWTYDAFGAKSSTVFGSDHDLHKIHRRAIAPFFAKTKVLARQDLLKRNTEKLFLRITSLVGTTFNLGAAISAFTRDNINEYVIGKSYNEIDLEDFGVALSIASQGAGVFWRTTKHVRWFGPTMRAMPVDWAMKIADDGTKSFLRYIQNSERDTRQTLAAAESPVPDTQVRNSMIHEMVHSALPSSEKTFDHIFEEVATVTSAGFETTANVLRLILFHIYANDDILRRLRKELSSLQPSETAALKQLEQLPYLTSIIKEGLRLSPGISSRMARITDQDLFYNNWRIPAGTPVGMTTILLHTDPKLYTDPMRFNPDRWMEPMANQNSDAVFAPFSSGTRTCLGMHLAWAEMYLVIANLVRKFNFTIKNVTAVDFELDTDNFGIGTKAGCNLAAFVTSYDD
ncbi:trichodiene oxygenase [Pestalotiopsis sp. NC0098]|nr:trichodiene oxygenase [Pestalotiopsis sp. NC0098]